MNVKLSAFRLSSCISRICACSLCLRSALLSVFFSRSASPLHSTYSSFTSSRSSRPAKPTTYRTFRKTIQIVFVLYIAAIGLFKSLPHLPSKWNEHVIRYNTNLHSFFLSIEWYRKWKWPFILMALFSFRTIFEIYSNDFSPYSFSMCLFLFDSAGVLCSASWHPSAYSRSIYIYIWSTFWSTAFTTYRRMDSTHSVRSTKRLRRLWGNVN